MVNTLSSVACLWMIALGVASAAHAQGFSIPPGVDTSKAGKMSYQGLRGIATTAPTPAYPATSLERKVTGVAVAEILLDQKGQLLDVNVLEAPDDAISESVHDSLMRWKFRPIAIPMKGKMFFYFTMKGPSGSVESPDEMNPALTHLGPPSNQNDDVVKIVESQLEVMQKRGKLRTLDVRDRSAYKRRHRDGDVNIPIDEVWPRASIELPVHLPIVVDCYPEQSPLQCAVAARILSYSGFDKVSVLAR